MNFVIVIRDCNTKKLNNVAAIRRAVKDRFDEKEKLENAFSNIGYAYKVTSNTTEVVCKVQPNGGAATVSAAYNMFSTLLEALAQVQFSLPHIKIFPSLVQLSTVIVQAEKNPLSQLLQTIPPIHELCSTTACLP